MLVTQIFDDKMHIIRCDNGMLQHRRNDLKMVSGPPLSWHEARRRLKRLLEEYLDESPPPTEKRNDNKGQTTYKILTLILNWDVDIYIGTLGSPTALLVIGCLVFVNGGIGSSSESADLKYRRSQLAASILVFLGGVLNLWLIRRRRYTTSQGSDSLKRREISRFLREIEKQEKDSSPSDSDRMETWPNLAGTSCSTARRIPGLSQLSHGCLQWHWPWLL